MSQRKQYTAMSAASDVEATFKLLEGRWKLAILFQLFDGQVRRFSDLERLLPGVTKKMLTAAAQGHGEGRHRLANGPSGVSIAGRLSDQRVGEDAVPGDGFAAAVVRATRGRMMRARANRRVRSTGESPGREAIDMGAVDEGEALRFPSADARTLLDYHPIAAIAPSSQRNDSTTC